VYCATASFGGSASGAFQKGEQLWIVSYPQGEVSRITNDLNNYGDASLGLTLDDSTLVTVQKAIRSEIWRVSRDLRDIRQITSGPEDGWAVITAATTKIAYSSSPTLYRSLWVANSDGSQPTQITPEGEGAGAFSISPDGHSIVSALASKEANKLDLWIMNSDGSNAWRLPLTGVNRTPNFSADRQSVYYTHQAEGKIYLFKFPLAVGDPVQVSDLQILTGNDSISHRGDRMFVWYFDEKSARWRFGILSLVTGKVLQTPVLSLPGALLSGAFLLPLWAVNDDAAIFQEAHNGVSNVWKMPLDGGPRTQLTHFTSDIIWTVAVAPDGTLYLARGNVESDAILIRNFR
jgi:Tol biopolymer transport system component